MQSKLVKPWGPYGVGTVIADNTAEAKAIPGAIQVNPDRFAKLHETGHLARAEPARPIPAEVKTAGAPARDFREEPPADNSARLAEHGIAEVHTFGRPIPPPFLDKHSDAPASPRSNSAPASQGDKADKEP